MTNLDKLKKKFLASKEDESEKIELDNLDWARLVEVQGEVKVENEHGTQFSVGDLSKEEVRIFLTVV
jgi:hypothetical protein